LLPVAERQDNLKISKETAHGIISEIASAANAPKWKSMMEGIIRQSKEVHPQVIDFYTMGDESFNPSLGTAKSFNPDPQKTQERVQHFKEWVSSHGNDLSHSTFKACSNDFNSEDEGAQDAPRDYAGQMNEITHGCTWGVKFLFQRFAIRNIASPTVDGWRLWPFAQPELNNRQIDLNAYLWEGEKESMVTTALNAVETEFQSQAVYSTPYSVTWRQSQLDLSLPLTSMLSGTQAQVSHDERIFTSLLARQCDLLSVTNCWKSIMVSLPAQLTKSDVASLLDWLSFLTFVLTSGSRRGSRDLYPI